VSEFSSMIFCPRFPSTLINPVLLLTYLVVSYRAKIVCTFDEVNSGVYVFLKSGYPDNHSK